jgi:hypothetical protein
LTHPELEPSMFENGVEGVRDDPSTKKKELGGPNGEDPAGWTAVTIDAKDWSRVLSVGRLNSRVIATFIPEHGLVLYVYLPNEENPQEESVLTVSQQTICQVEVLTSQVLYKLFQCIESEKVRRTGVIQRTIDKHQLDQSNAERRLRTALCRPVELLCENEVYLGR